MVTTTQIVPVFNQEDGWRMMPSDRAIAAMFWLVRAEVPAAANELDGNLGELIGELETALQYTDPFDPSLWEAARWIFEWCCKHGSGLGPEVELKINPTTREVSFDWRNELYGRVNITVRYLNGQGSVAESSWKAHHPRGYALEYIRRALTGEE